MDFEVNKFGKIILLTNSAKLYAYEQVDEQIYVLNGRSNVPSVY